MLRVDIITLELQEQKKHTSKHVINVKETTACLRDDSPRNGLRPPTFFFGHTVVEVKLLSMSSSTELDVDEEVIGNFVNFMWNLYIISVSSIRLREWRVMKVSVKKRMNVVWREKVEL